MSVRNRWASLNLFWKTLIFLVLLVTFVVTLAEGVLEPFAERFLIDFSGGFKPWHEVVMWGVSIAVPSLACGFIFSRILARRAESMAAAADRLSLGDFSARIAAHETSRDAFERLARSFNGMASSLDSLVKNERRLLADISHELRSPLARMGIALELLRLKRDAASRDALMDRLEKETNHMGELVGLMLAHGRERLAVSPPEEEAVDLSALLREVAKDMAFHGQADGKGVAASIPDGVTVAGRASRMRTMLMNVGVNALFHTPAGKPVRISLDRGEETVCVRIRDYGPGAPEDQLEYIFRAFYRVDDSRARATGGAGLGLALAREAAELCGGAIEARNANPGLEVRITLPAPKA